MVWSFTKEVDVTAKNRAFGTFDANGVTGGDIVTGFPAVKGVNLQVVGGSANKAAVVNETITAGEIPGTFTVVCDNGAVGFWEAISR